jgi:hypothetical protein
VGGEIFGTRLDRPWGPPSLFHNGHRISSTGLKRSGRGVYHTTPSSTDVKKRLELFFYSPLCITFIAYSRVNSSFTTFYVVLPSAVFILDIFILKHCFSSNLIAPSVRGRYLVVSIVLSSHFHRIGISFLCETTLIYWLCCCLQYRNLEPKLDI